MAEIGKILVVIEANESADSAERLVTKAGQLACRVGAVLELFVCCFNRALAATYLFDPEARQHAEQGFLHGQEKRIESLISDCLPEGVEATGDVHWERDLEHGILQKIARYAPDMVVKSCRYHPLLERALFGHLEGQLIRHCPVPLLLVKNRDWGRSPQVMAAVDPLHDHDKPESLDRAIVEQARTFTAAIGGHLHLIHAFQPLPASVVFDDTLVLDYEGFKEKLRVQHEEAMARLVADSGLEAQTPVHVVQGETASVLPDCVNQQNGDLVVMGSVDRSGLDRLFMGSTAEDTLNRLECDLLVVKPPGFQGPEAAP
ncbi:universal stress protein [Motiliproteus sp. SC1-56]|uniref:universal stress protein n=1 Tax=Motiliproteus sp. SC1-56 TaxID=2799565 RepID=UPI001A8D69DF|nr:universal stress protein [Motiliproteus sp. SC1-56]